MLFLNLERLSAAKKPPQPSRYRATRQHRFGVKPNSLIFTKTTLSVNFRHLRHCRDGASSRPGPPRHCLGSGQPWDHSIRINSFQKACGGGAPIQSSVMPMAKFRLRFSGASVTEGKPFLPLAISLLRLFGNEDRHSQRSPRLHMVRVFAV
jgi:hypothetical protein